MIQVILGRELGLPAMPDLPFIFGGFFARILLMFLLLCSPGADVTLRPSKARSGSTRRGRRLMIEHSVCVSIGVTVAFAIDAVRFQDYL